jgi:uncharacterized membrane protein
VKILNWIISRLVAALVLGIALSLLGYYVLAPIVINAVTKQQLSIDRFTIQSGSGAAGSEDAVYFAARYDCRNTLTRISGEAPDAPYWMIGIYDNRFQRIPGGHFNNETIEIDENGQFHVVIQHAPGNAQNTLECQGLGTGIVIMRVFLPADREAVTAPTIERLKLQ